MNDASKLHMIRQLISDYYNQEGDETGQHHALFSTEVELVEDLIRQLRNAVAMYLSAGAEADDAEFKKWYASQWPSSFAEIQAGTNDDDVWDSYRIAELSWQNALLYARKMSTGTELACCEALESLKREEEMLTKSGCLDLVNNFNKRRTQRVQEQIEKLESQIPEVLEGCLSLVKRAASKGQTFALLYSDFGKRSGVVDPLSCYHNNNEGWEPEALRCVEKRVFKELRNLGFKNDVYVSEGGACEVRISWKQTLWERFLKLIKKGS